MKCGVIKVFEDVKFILYKWYFNVLVFEESEIWIENEEIFVK